MYTFLLLALAIVYGVLAWRNLRLALYLLMAALPLYLLRFGFFNLPSTALELLFWILTLAWIARRHMPDPLQPIADPTAGLGRWLPAIVAIFLASIIGIFAAPDMLEAAGIWKAYFLEPLILFFLIRSLLQTPREREQLIDAIGVGALFVALVAIGQWALDAGIPTPWDVERRVTSVFGYPNAVGLFLGPILALGLFRVRQEPRLWVPTLACGGLAILLAQSEAAIVAVVATAVLAGLLIPKTRVLTGIATVCVALTILIVPTLRTLAIQKFTLQDYSGHVRLTQWEETLNLLRDQPILGAGLSGYPTALFPYHTHTEIEIFQYPHTIILNTWVELGLLGLVGLGLLAVVVVKAAWPSLRESARDPEAPRAEQALVLACVFALMEMAIHGLVDVPYFKNDLAMLTWALIAILSLSYVPFSTAATPKR